MHVLLIPYHEKDSLLLPKPLVRYILPYAPMLPPALKNDMVIGSLIYENEKIPVVDFSKQSMANRGINTQAKLIIVACISDSRPVNSYAVMAAHAPTVLQVQEHDIEETYERVPRIFHSLVRIKKDENHSLVFVPNMEKIEEELFTT